MSKIEAGKEVIDSREIVERIEELESEKQGLVDAVEEAQAAYEYHDSEDTKSTPEWSDLVEARKALALWLESEEETELESLKALAEQGEQESRDWIHGETLIHRRYWVDFTAETIHDCYEMPKGWPSGEWPFRHMTIDYEAAAEELEHDYASIDFDGHEYLIRSC
jgi:hypothetical protein